MTPSHSPHVLLFKMPVTDSTDVINAGYLLDSFPGVFLLYCLADSHGSMITTAPPTVALLDAHCNSFLISETLIM